MATISEIRRELSETHPENYPAFIEKYGSDSRSGVLRLVDSCRRHIEQAQREAERLERMLVYEKKYYAGCDYICGIDEAGRGPLAGPVVAACVQLAQTPWIEGVRDSKKIAEARRE